MSTLALTYSKIKSINMPVVPWKTVLAAGIVAMLALLVLYVVLMLGLTNGAYAMKEYDGRVDTLADRNRMLEMEVAQTDVLSHVAERARGAGFEKTTGIKYVQVLENSLATR